MKRRVRLMSSGSVMAVRGLFMVVFSMPLSCQYISDLSFTEHNYMMGVGDCITYPRQVIKAIHRCLI